MKAIQGFEQTLLEWNKYVGCCVLRESSTNEAKYPIQHRLMTDPCTYTTHVRLLKLCNLTFKHASERLRLIAVMSQNIRDEQFKKIE